jgi:hypothetical protein
MPHAHRAECLCIGLFKSSLVHFFLFLRSDALEDRGLDDKEKVDIWNVAQSPSW